MTKNSFVVLGDNRLAQELSNLGREKGLDLRAFSSLGDIQPITPVVIETLAGDGERKKSILEKLDEFLSPASVIVSSCLAYSTTHMAAWTTNPERIVGFASFYPLKDRKVIELAAGMRSAEIAVSAAEQFFKLLGKETLRVKDSAGLTFPRILSLIINEAARALEEGVASAEEIDTAMKLGVNYPLGPLRWADQIGLDEVLAVLEGLGRETGDDRYRPAPLLKKLVIAGFLGEARGKGFYLHNEGQVKP
jgi:3-hydroxybutyryl-CoA dehydrogenase